MQARTTAYVEIGAKRAFAGAIEWPGWLRSGKTDVAALEALVAYAPRYAGVAGRAGQPTDVFAAIADVRGLEIVERLKGDATTDFGAPGQPPEADARELDDVELARLSALLRAAWDTFDAAAKRHAHAQLRTGPRGGGRDVARMTEHVRDAEKSYLSQLGSRVRSDELGAIRAAALDALPARARGDDAPDPRPTKRPWLPRYYVRRSAWHALDHAWEIEDRAET